MKWTIIPALLGGGCNLTLAMAGAFLTSAAGKLVAGTALTGVLVTMPLWMTGVFAGQHARLPRIGKAGFYAALGGLTLIGIWFALSGWNRFQPWNAVSLVLFLWGTLVFGTATLGAGRFPPLATALWMAGAVMACSTLSGQWPGRFLFIGAGMIWSGFFCWKTWEATPVSASSEGDRHHALDLLRGLIMILMAIDHAKVFILRTHEFEFWNLAAQDYGGDAAMFLTRFVTHFCAPGFFLLMGAGMVFLARSRENAGWTGRRIMGHLALRGLLLVTLEKLLWDPLVFGHISATRYGVLFGLGGVMAAAVLFLRLNARALLILGLAAILVSQALPRALLAAGAYNHPAVYLLLAPQMLSDWQVLYPVFPWLGITLLGMAMGRILAGSPDTGYRWIHVAGWLSLALFFAIRWAGGFGNFQPPAGPGWIPFFSLVKYPPSLAFILLTLGVNCLLITLFHRLNRGWWQHILTVFGKTALFFYLAHWYMFAVLGSFFSFITPDLVKLYLAWAVGLVLLFPACRLFLDFKGQTPPNSGWRMI